MQKIVHSKRVLVCDDEKNMRNLLLDVLEDDGWEVTLAEDGSQALEVMAEASIPFPVMVVDLSMPGIDGFEVIKRTREMGLDTNIIVITAYGTVDTAVRAMQAGASDFVVKPFDNVQIRGAVRRAFDSRDLLTQVEMSHPRFLGADNAPLPIIGKDERLQSVFNIVRRIANLNTAVLIQGESGTGKELVAQAIHFNGNRADQPFVAVNCGALPEALLESEFFGHERGAFTGAHALQRGKFEIANGGTMFLDEIGEMPLPLQVKFLRVLQDQRFSRVGGEREHQTNVRIIAATNRDLQEAIGTKTFREDLYYRLNVIPIHLPPLRERRGDIPQLVEFFLDRFCRRHNLPTLVISDSIMDGACNRDWPGNIRELQNAVEKAVILQDAQLIATPMPPIGKVATSSDSVPVQESTPSPDVEPDAPTGGTAHPNEHISGDSFSVDLGVDGGIRELSDVSADAQRAAVIRALRLCNGNKAEAAKRLGVSYKTLFNRINELGISVSTNVE